MSEQPEITVKKYSAFIQVPQELLDDTRLDLNVFLNPNRRQRFRRWVRQFRTHLAERAYRIISGHDLPEPEPEPEDWD